MASPVAVRGGEALYFTRSAGRLNTALYGEHRMERRRLILAAGAMAHLVSGSRKIGFYPGADAAFRIHPAFSLYGSLNKTLRMPTFTDLYYTSPIQQANPRLKPEKAVSAEGAPVAQPRSQGNSCRIQPERPGNDRLGEGSPSRFPDMEEYEPFSG